MGGEGRMVGRGRMDGEGEDGWGGGGWVERRITCATMKSMTVTSLFHQPKVIQLHCLQR